MGNIGNEFLEAIDIIASSKINSAGFNRTIQATIIQCQDATIGKYKVRYQDGIFYAYTQNSSVSYSKDTLVYILIPNGDMSSQKIILGSVSKLGANYINIITNEQQYNVVGNNVIKEPNANNWNLCSYSSGAIVLYNKNSNNNVLTIDNRAAEEYFKNSDCIMISADVRTNLPEQQHRSGNYGIKIGLNFKDPGTSSQRITTRDYYLSVDEMTGDPYNFVIKTKQQKILDIDKENFVEINDIELFVKNFPNQATGKKPDIFISNIQLCGVEKLSVNDLNSYALVLKTPKGYIFTTKDTSTSVRTIEAQLRIKGQPADPTDQNIQYFWFEEDNSIISDSPFYNKYGGQGWKCLNQYNVIQEASQQGSQEPATAVYQFLSGSYQLNILKNNIITEHKKYKCVLIYSGNVFSKEIQFLNTDSEYKVEIQSDSGTHFYLNNGTPILSCLCYNRSNNQDTQLDSDNFDYVWSVVNNVNNFNIISNSNNRYVLNQNTLQLNVNTITNFSTFKCSVFSKQNNFQIGTASIVIYNSLEQEDKGLSLVINNKSQVFKYSTTGISPASSQLEHPIDIIALTFNLYQNGQLLSDSEIGNCDITWKVPQSNYTLIKPSSNYTEEPKQEGDHYRLYKNLTSFGFTIEDNYDFYKNENQIELQVVYNGAKIIERTDLIFIKEGQMGTNGTDFVCRIVPNVINGTKIPLNPTIYYDGSEVNFNWDNAGISDGRWFKAQLWHNGSLIYQENKKTDLSNQNKQVTIRNWEILKNRYNSLLEDKTLININFQDDNNQNGWWSFSFDSTNIPDSNYINWCFANIVKVTLQYDNSTYYATLPLNFYRLWDNNYKIELKDYSGFNRVLYSSGGTKPFYDSHAPFIINTYHKVGLEWEDVSLNDEILYQWFYIGSIQERTGDLTWREKREITSNEGVSSGYWLSEARPRYDLEEENIILKNQKWIKPSENYSGQCVTVGLACRVYTENNLIGWFLAPIHMSLNRYENSAFNDWDGNSIELGDNNGGLILAPQVGAGIKSGEDNSFTGLFIGTAKDSKEELIKSATSLNAFGDFNEDVGLFGYSSGRRSIFLDARTGKAIFGTTGAGQIIIDPSTQQALIRSGNYVPAQDNIPGSGMQINLSEPNIDFGSGNFSVSSTGLLKAKGAILTELNLSASTASDGTSLSQYFVKVDEYEGLVNSLLQPLKAQIDGQITSWYNDGVPTLNNYPYTDWINVQQIPGESQADREARIAKAKADHEGDIYYDRTTQISYRFTNNGTKQNPIWTWAVIRDTGISEAMTAAANAQRIANNKRRVFGVTPQSADAYDEGDLWVNATYPATGDNKIYQNDVLVCQTSKAAGEAFNIQHWRKASAYLDNYRYQPRVLMNKLTGNDNNNGIWMSDTLTDNKLYINANYIKTGAISVSNADNRETFFADTATGEVRINATQLSITGVSVQDRLADLKTASNNILRGTNKQIIFSNSYTYGVDSGSWSNGKWRKGSDLNATRSCVDIGEKPPISILKYKWVFDNNQIVSNDIAQDNIPVQPGAEYIFSCYVKGAGILKIGYGRPGSPSKYKTKKITVPQKNNWTRVCWITSISIQNGYTSKVNNKIVTNVYFGNAGIGTLEICGMTMGRGNVDTGWSPAPEDVKNEVDTEMLSQKQIMDRLTNYGEEQGIYLDNNQIFINASFIKVGEIDAERISTGLLKDKKGNCNINLDTGQIDLLVKTLKIRMKDKNGREIAPLEMTPENIRLSSGKLTWESENSSMDEAGHLTIRGGADITGTIKNTYTSVSRTSDWSIASKVLMTNGDLIFYSNFGTRSKPAKIQDVSQFGRISGGGEINGAKGITIRSTGDSSFVGFGANGSEANYWSTGQNYNVPFLYARKDFTINSPTTDDVHNVISIPKSTLHAFVNLYLHKHKIYQAVLDSPRLINPTIDKAVNEILEFYVCKKVDGRYQQIKLRLPFKNGILVTGTDFPAKNNYPSDWNRVRPALSNVKWYVPQDVRFGLIEGSVDGQDDG